MNYDVAYRIGFHPWEDAEHQPRFVARFLDLVAEEEAQARHEGAFGAALDLGTGSGIWAVKLAQRGWRVTGVDLVERALGRADERARAALVNIALVHGDVTALRAAGLGRTFRLVIDTGTFHGLDRAQQVAMGEEVEAVAADDATVLLLGWTPRRRGLLPRGVGIDDVQRACPGWTVTDAGPTGFTAPRPVELLLRPGERWYRLRRS